MLPEDLLNYRPRKVVRRDYVWAALAAALALTAWLEPLPPQARQLTQLQEEEGARAVAIAGEVIAARFGDGPRDLSAWRLSSPLVCSGRRGDQWILQGERTGLPARLPRCVNADLRRAPYAP